MKKVDPFKHMTDAQIKAFNRASSMSEFKTSRKSVKHKIIANGASCSIINLLATDNYFLYNFDYEEDILCIEPDEKLKKIPFEKIFGFPKPSKDLEVFFSDEIEIVGVSNLTINSLIKKFKERIYDFYKKELNYKMSKSDYITVVSDGNIGMKVLYEFLEKDNICIFIDVNKYKKIFYKVIENENILYNKDDLFNSLMKNYILQIVKLSNKEKSFAILASKFTNNNEFLNILFIDLNKKPKQIELPKGNKFLAFVFVFGLSKNDVKNSNVNAKTVYVTYIDSTIKYIIIFLFKKPNMLENARLEYDLDIPEFLFRRKK